MLAFSPFFKEPAPCSHGYTLDDPTTCFSELHCQSFNPFYFTNDHHQQAFSSSPIDQPIPPFGPMALPNDQLIPPFGPMILPHPLEQGCLGGDQPWSVEELSGNGAGMANTVEETAVEDERKLYHNASERNRRKRINALYASLRALLPATYKKKKLSIPMTISTVTKYIPELQKDVEALRRRKQELWPYSNANATTISFQRPTYNNTSHSSTTTSSRSVQVINLGNGEISVQVATLTSLQRFVSISEILQELEEEEGVVVIDVSSLESCAGRVFHHIHLMTVGIQTVKCEVLREKILAWCQKWEKRRRWMY